MKEKTFYKFEELTKAPSENKNAQMLKISVRLPVSVYEQIQTLACANNIDFSQQLRELIRTSMENEQEQRPKQ